MSLLKHNRRRRGMALVEAALVLWLLILVTYGMIEYGTLMLHLQQIENVAREGARAAAMPDATSADVNNLISNMMTNIGFTSSDYVPTVVMNVSRGQQVSVTISVAYKKFSITNSSYAPVPDTVSRTVVMAKEGP